MDSLNDARLGAAPTPPRFLAYPKGPRRRSCGPSAFGRPRTTRQTLLSILPETRPPHRAVARSGESTISDECREWTSAGLPFSWAKRVHGGIERVAVKNIPLASSHFDRRRNNAKPDQLFESSSAAAPIL